MTPEQFAYWLRGFQELGGEAPTPDQWKVIKEKLAEAFRKPEEKKMAEFPFKPLRPLGHPASDINVIKY